MEIVFSSVSLKHLGKNEYLLKEFSYQILPGKIIGLCGENVSQISKMMAFLLPTSAGQIMVDLCTQLKCYDLLKVNYVPLEEMEELLWK